MSQDNDIAAREKGATPAKRMRIFRAAEATDVTPEEMPMIGIDNALVAGMAEQLAARQQGVSPEESKFLFREPGGAGISLVRAWFKSGYVLPRHSHSADCLYYVLAGEARMGAQVLRPGDGVFVPADAGYTIEAGADGLELLEFRNATHFNMVFRNNDAAHFEKMSAAFRDNKERWADEPRPSERDLSAPRGAR